MSEKVLFRFFVVAVVFLSALTCYADNMWERHGNNFIYLEYVSESEYDTQIYFPIIWDERNAFFQLRDYYESYGWVTDSAYATLDELIEDAWDHGINFANVRAEIGRMSASALTRPRPDQQFVKVAEIVRNDSLSLIAGGFKTSLTTSHEGPEEERFS